MRIPALTPLLLAGTALLLSTACTRTLAGQAFSSADNLTGAWRSQIRFSAGVLAVVPNLEFLYAYNAGGTMTESSNYDEAANSSPPAYGVWRKTGPQQFETKYQFYQTRAPEQADGPGNAGGWLPAGHGILTEVITLSADGTTYTSTINYASFDKNDSLTTNGGTGTGAGTRIRFD